MRKNDIDNLSTLLIDNKPLHRQHLGNSFLSLLIRPVDVMTSDQTSAHPLTTPLSSIGMLGYPLADNIETYLEFLYEAQLFDTLNAGYPGEDIISNLLNAYAQISEAIFWSDDEAQEELYEEALRSFPLLVEHSLKAKLDLKKLYDIADIVTNFFDWEQDDDGPAHLSHLKPFVQKFSNLFQVEDYKTAIYEALNDTSRRDFYELISLAHWFYNENEFELFFSFAKQQPVKVLFYSHWLAIHNHTQIRQFLGWARKFMPSQRLMSPLARTFTYGDVEYAVLERVLFSETYLLTDLQDRQEFAIWGLSSTNQHLAANGAWLLEDMPVPDWPAGSLAIIQELFDIAEPHWTTWIKTEVRYTTVKERLGALIRKAPHTLGGATR